MIEYDRHYDCSDEEALTRLRSLANYWEKKFGVVGRWEDSTAFFDGKVKGVKFKGKVEIGGQYVRARVEAGFLAEKLGAKKYVTRKVDDYLDPANSIAALDARIP